MTATIPASDVHLNHTRHAPGCAACQRRSAAYSRRIRRRRAHGYIAYVDAEPSRQHALALKAQGIGWKRIAVLAGVPESTVGNLLYGNTRYPPTRQIRPETAAAILAVTATLENIAPLTAVPAVGSQRRLRALAALGWPQNRLATELGIAPQNVGRVLNGHALSAALAIRIRDLYDRLSMTPPPEDTPESRTRAQRTRARAARLGWASSLAWDDDTIDDPFAEPQLDADETDAVDEHAVEALLAGRLRAKDVAVADRRAAIAILVSRGTTARMIADRIGLASRTIERLLAAS